MSAAKIGHSTFVYAQPVVLCSGLLASNRCRQSDYSIYRHLLFCVRPMHRVYLAVSGSVRGLKSYTVHSDLKSHRRGYRAMQLIIFLFSLLLWNFVLCGSQRGGRCAVRGLGTLISPSTAVEGRKENCTFAAD